MRCHNFLCNQHDPTYRTNCGGYVVPGSGNNQFVKNCESRKRYNLWDRYISNCRVEWVKRKWKEMKDKYYGRDKS